MPALIIGVFLLVELGALVLFCRSRCASDGNGVVSLPLVSFFGGAFFFSVLAIIFLGSLIHVDLATQPALIWASGGVISGLIAFGVARRFESLFGAELLLAVIFSVQALAVAALWSGPSVDWTAPELRSLIVAPFILALASYFGSSLGLLLAGGGFSGGLGYESFVSLRFLLTRSSRALSTVTTISVVGVALGVWLVIISLGILSGFENDLQEKIIGANAHILLHKSSGRPFPISDSLTTKVEAQSGVSATAPFVEGDVALASESNYTAGLLHGIDIKRSPKVLDILSTLKFGRLEDLVGEKTKQVAEADSEFGFAAPRKSPGIMLGVEMAKALNVTLGDQVRVISPLHEVLTPVGVAPRSLGYRVVAIFDSGMYDHDARYAYVDIGLAREFFELKTDEVSGVQIRTDDSRYSASVASSLGASISEFDLEALDWKARNRTLFAALELERIVAFVV
ncbi:ABC transporter permease, partial [Myxococcota bacterium]|nr:ABC transporter permease [Myxococcota bacterium]